MKSEQNIKIYVTRNDVTEDLSEGTLSLNFQNGVDSYEGVWQRPDVGQLVLVTRNPQFDPNVNPNIRFNTSIVVDELFTGFITDINVEYRPAGQPAIITVNAVDIIGLAQRHLWTEEFADYCKNEYINNPSPYIPFSGRTDAMTLTDLSLALLQYADETGKEEIPNFYIYTEEWIDSLDGTIFVYDNTPSTVITAGENAWDTIVKLSQSNLSHLTNMGTVTNSVELLEHPYEKYSPRLYMGMPTWYDFMFSSEGDGLSYKNIVIDDGYGRTVNQVKVENENTTLTASSTATYGPYVNDQSIDFWGSSELTIDTMLAGIDDVETTYERLSRDILESASNPKLMIKEITFDGNKYPEAAFTLGADGFVRVRIKHKVNETFTIDRIYEIVGRKHEINESDWYVTLLVTEDIEYLAESKTFSQPEILINGAYDEYFEVNTGTSDFMWEASITNFPTDQIATIEWNFATEQNGALGTLLNGGPTHSTDPIPTWNYAWPNSYGLEEPDTVDGYKVIRATITTIDGWKVVALKDILVIPDNPAVDFVYSRDAFGVYTFTNTSITDTSPGSETNWTWTFGDGTSSSLRNPPTKTYATFGTYTVTLTATNWFGGQDFISKNVVYEGAYADFTSAQSPTSWNTTNFTYTGSNVLTYAWDFGNGQTSTLKNPYTVYTAPGDYTVTLTVTDNLGSDSITKTVTVVAPPGEWGTLPVRYLKITQPSFYYSYGTVGAGPRMMFLSNFQARKSDGTNRALDKNVISLNNISGVLSQNTNDVTAYSTFADCYGSTKAGFHDQWNYATSPQRLTKASGTNTLYSGVYTESKWTSTQPGNCMYSQWSVVIDLGAAYNDINNLRMNISTLYATNSYAVLTVSASTDNVTWYDIGTINPNGIASGGYPVWVNMTPSVTMPPNLP